MPFTTVPTEHNGNTYLIKVQNTNGTNEYVQLTMPVLYNGVDGYSLISSSNPMPVSMSLPTGAATSAKQDTAQATLASIDSKLPADPATGTKQDTANNTLSNINSKVGLNRTTNSNSTQLINGSAAVQILAANANRKSVAIQNKHTETGAIGIGTGTLTFASGMELYPGQVYEPLDVPTDAISIIFPSSVTNAPVYKREGV